MPRIVAVTQRRPGAFVVFRFEARDRAGERVSTTDFGALYRGVTVEGGEHRLEATEDPQASPGELSQAGILQVPATAAHVYTECARIWNPIHTDIAYARAAGLPTIILHGTATLAFSISLILRTFEQDPRSVRRVQCRFSGMVPMPATLTVHAAREGGRLGFETRDAAGEAVISRGSLLLQ